MNLVSIHLFFVLFDCVLFHSEWDYVKNKKCDTCKVIFYEMVWMLNKKMHSFQWCLKEILMCKSHKPIYVVSALSSLFIPSLTLFTFCDSAESVETFWLQGSGWGWWLESLLDGLLCIPRESHGHEEISSEKILSQHYFKTIIITTFAKNFPQKHFYQI